MYRIAQAKNSKKHSQIADSQAYFISFGTHLFIIIQPIEYHIDKYRQRTDIHEHIPVHDHSPLFS